MFVKLIDYLATPFILFKCVKCKGHLVEKVYLDSTDLYLNFLDFFRVSAEPVHGLTGKNIDNPSLNYVINFETSVATENTKIQVFKS